MRETDLVSDDITALNVYEYQKRVGPVVEALREVVGSFDSLTDIPSRLVFPPLNFARR